MPWWRKSQHQPAEVTTASALPLIRLEHVTRSFKSDADERTRALEDVTVDIHRGEYLTVWGPSGCGKWTFLSILALLDQRAAGRYWLSGGRGDRLSRPDEP